MALRSELHSTYWDAPQGERITRVLLFAISNASTLDAYSSEELGELCLAARIPANYDSFLRYGRNLAPFVEVARS